MDDDELDTEWIDNEAQKEEEYDDFYRSTVNKVSVTLLYVSNDNVVQHIKRNKQALENGILNRSMIVDIVKKNRMLSNTNYSLYALLKYNFNVDSSMIINGILGDETDYCEIITHIDDIFFDKTIEYFQSLNDIIIVLKPRERKSLTKKVFISTKKKKRRTRKR